MIKREWVLAVLEKMPEKFSVDDFIEQLLINKKLDIAMQELEEGRFLTSDELEIEMKKWFNES